MPLIGSKMFADGTGEQDDRLPTAASTAELAECTCPDFCERDHDVD
jgi:hypothetical protein